MNSKRSKDQSSKDKSSLRHKRDLIDLSFEINDATGSGMILDLFDPLKQDAIDKRTHENERNHKHHYDIKLTERPSLKTSHHADGRRRIQRNRSSSTCASIYHEGPSTIPMDRECNSSKLTNKPIKFVNTESKGSHSSGEPVRSDENAICGQLNKFNIVQSISIKSLIKDNTLKPTNRGWHRDLSGKNQLRTKNKCESTLRLNRKSQRSNQEITDLALRLKAFRAKFKHNDQGTNLGIVMSPTLYRSSRNDLNVKVTITSPLSSEPISFDCNISTSIEHLISHALFSMLEDPSDEASNYVLKVTGKNEYLGSDLCLADYAFVSNCCKFDQDVKLTMIRLDSLKRPFQRTANDDFHCKSLLCPDDLLPRSSILKYSDLNYEALNIIIETFDREAHRLYQDVTNKSTCLQTQSLTQTTKAICSLMMNCESGQITESTKNITQLCASYREEGDQLAEDDRYKVIEVIQHAIKRLLKNMHALLRLTSDNLPVDYEVLDMVSNKIAPSNHVEIPIDSVHDKVTVKIHHVSQLKPEWLTRFQEFHIEVNLMFGKQLLCSGSISSTIRIDKSFFHRLLFDEEITLNLDYSRLPREARFLFTLVGTEILPAEIPSHQLSVPVDEPQTIRRSRSMNSICSTAPMFTSSPRGSQSNLKQSDEPNQVPLAISMEYLFNSRLNLIQGDKLLCMHSIEDSKRPYDMYHQITPDRQDSVMVVGFKSFTGKRVHFPSDGSEPSSTEKNDQTLSFDDLDSGHKFVIRSILNDKDFQDPLMDDEKNLLWENRLYLSRIPRALPLLLQSVPDWSAKSLTHIYELLDIWSPMQPVEALQLLQPTFADTRVRSTALRWIAKQSDDELYDYLPQLLQVFRFEKQVDCSLFWLIIERALRNVRIANLAYWQLKLNSNDRLLQDRSEILTNCLLWVCGAAFWKSVDKQEYLVGQLNSVSSEIERARDHNRLGLLRKKLEIIQDDLMSKKPTLPCATGIEVCDLEISSCYYFPSKTLPLKLAFRSCEESSSRAIKFHNYDTIFKTGDDLRQDMIVIQMIRIMEKLWLREGLDLQMVTFDCMATNERQGLVEMVRNAETLRKIQQSSGFLAGSFDPKAIDNYLRLWNTSEKEYQTALNRFLRSCAGYSLATYVLGICDRHNDNIMITRSGHLFHIDFGKFLGDAQMMGFIKRDRTPFVLSTDMVYVINGGDRPSERFQTFVELCEKAFSILRHHRTLFLNLFSLMTSAKIHNLNTDSVSYVHKMLMPELSDSEARAKFTKLIGKCINSRATQVNFFIHNLAHVSKSFISTSKRGKKDRAE